MTPTPPTPYTPSPKVAAAGIAGAVSIILVWVLTVAGFDVPATVGSAITAVVAFGAGYIKQP